MKEDVYYVWAMKKVSGVAEIHRNKKLDSETFV